MTNAPRPLGWPLRVVPDLMWRAVRVLDGEAHRVIEAPDAHAMLRSSERRTSSGSMIADLLAQSLVQNTDEARESLAVAAVQGLVPDEARVLLTVSKLGWVAAVHVDAGRSGELSDQTLLGRKAGLSLPDQAPFYVRRLLARGLLVRTEDRPVEAEEYEVLLAEPAVLAALRTGRRGARPARVERTGVELSELGRSVLAAARPREDAR